MKQSTVVRGLSKVLLMDKQIHAKRLKEKWQNKRNVKKQEQSSTGDNCNLDNICWIISVSSLIRIIVNIY